MKQNNYLRVPFDHFWIWCSWGSIESLLEPKVEPLWENLAWPNPRNTIYKQTKAMLKEKKIDSSVKK